MVNAKIINCNFPSFYFTFPSPLSLYLSMYVLPPQYTKLKQNSSLFARAELFQRVVNLEGVNLESGKMNMNILKTHRKNYAIAIRV